MLFSEARHGCTFFFVNVRKELTHRRAGGSFVRREGPRVHAQLAR